jgi:tRNA pseudouridine38-40 synthase
MPNYRLTLTFEGTNYHGWQIQPNALTVQEVIERAVAQTVGKAVRVLGCGRTDAGVHAENYVANFSVDSGLSPERMRAALNSRLPDDVVVTACDVAADDFHATLSARGKVYRYAIATGDVRPVPDRNFVYHCRHTLDVEAMRRSATTLVGEHDFASFVTEHSPDKVARGMATGNTVRIIRRLDITSSGRYVFIEIEGNGFLYNMVRTIAGCLIAVGRGLRSPQWMKEVLDARDRTSAFETAPAKGLTLVRAIY